MYKESARLLKKLENNQAKLTLVEKEKERFGSQSFQANECCERNEIKTEEQRI